MKSLSKKEKQYMIEEISSSRVILRSIGLLVTIYFIINFNDGPEIYGISIFIISFLLLVKDESYKIKSDSKRIEITHSNILNILPSKQVITYSEINYIEFVPSEFSFTMFFLNIFIRSGTNSSKESVLTIYKKNGEKIEMRNIGDEEDVNYLRQWL